MPVTCTCSPSHHPMNSSRLAVWPFGLWREGGRGCTQCGGSAAGRRRAHSHAWAGGRLRHRPSPTNSRSTPVVITRSPRRPLANCQLVAHVRTRRYRSYTCAALAPRALTGSRRASSPRPDARSHARPPRRIGGLPPAGNARRWTSIGRDSDGRLEPLWTISVYPSFSRGNQQLVDTDLYS